jgi:hypothetical protein
MNSEVEEWETSLQLALDWNVEKENYEFCAKIHKLIQDIRTSLTFSK